MGDVVERIIIDVDSSGAVVGARKAAGAMKEVSVATGQAEKSAKKSGGVMKSALGLGILFAAHSAVQFGKDSIAAFRTSEQQMRSADQTLKSTLPGWAQHREAILKTIDAHEKIFKFDRDELVQSFSRLTATTHNSAKGFDLQTTAMDIARERHISLATATDKLVKIYNGQTRGAKGLGVQFAAVTTAQDALAKSTKHATKEQKDAAKAQDKQASVAAVIAALKTRFHGQAMAYAKSEQGIQAGATIAFERSQKQIGKALIPVQRAMIQAFLPVAVFLGNNASAVGKFILALTGIVVAVKLVTLATKAWEAAQAVGVGIMAAYNGLQSIFVTRTAMATAQTQAQAAAQAELDVAMSANPIGIVVVALAALAAGFIYAYKHSATFRAIVQGALHGISVAGQAVLDFFRGNWKTIAVLISGPFAPVVALATNAFGIRDKLIGAFGAIQSKAASIIQAIVGFFKGLPGKARAALAALPGAILGLLAGLATSAFNAAKHIGEQIVAGIGAGVANLASSVGSKIKSGVSSAVSNIGGAIGSIFHEHHAPPPGSIAPFASEEENLAVAEITPTKKDDLPILKRIAARNLARYNTARKRFMDVPRFMKLRNDAHKKLVALIRAHAKPKAVAAQAALVAKWQAAIDGRRQGLVTASQELTSANESVSQAVTDIGTEDQAATDAAAAAVAPPADTSAVTAPSPDLSSVTTPAATPFTDQNPGGIPAAMPSEVTVNLGSGMEWLAQFINIQVNGLTTRARTRSLAGGRTF